VFRASFMYDSYMNKILEKIYSEKDLPTNIAVFFGAMSFLYVYIRFDNDPFLGLVALLSVFSLVKVVSGIAIEKYKYKQQRILNRRYYSDLEQGVISAFTKNGTCFLVLKDLEKGKFDVDSDGLDSLVARGVVEFVDRSFGDGPTGFQLNEEVYRMFLNK